MYDPERAFGVEFMDDREVRERRANTPTPEVELVRVEQRTEAETLALAMMGGLAMMLAPDVPIRSIEYQESVEMAEEAPRVDFEQEVVQISHTTYEQIAYNEQPDTTQQALTRAAYELAA